MEFVAETAERERSRSFSFPFFAMFTKPGEGFIPVKISGQAGAQLFEVGKEKGKFPENVVDVFAG
jgi:hypothetical protein